MSILVWVSWALWNAEVWRVKTLLTNRDQRRCHIHAVTADEDATTDGYEQEAQQALIDEQQPNNDPTQSDRSSAVEIIDLESFCNSSEVIIGAVHSAGIVGIFDDTVPFEPVVTSAQPNNAQANGNTNTSANIRSVTEPALPSVSPDNLLNVINFTELIS